MTPSGAYREALLPLALYRLEFAAQSTVELPAY